MSQKNRDEKNRQRNVTISFRMSPEERDDLNMRVHLSGLTKQEYIIRRLQEKEITVVGNPRVYKALKDALSSVLTELQRIEQVSENNDLMIETIHLITTTLNGMKNKEDYSYD